MASSARNLVVRSGDRISGTASNFVVKLPYGFPIYTAELYEVQIPNTIYKITTKNNILDFNDGAVLSITIPPGAYTIATLATAIYSLLNSASSGFNALVYNPDTMKLTISRTSNFSLLFGTGANLSRSIASVIGFSAVDLAGAGTYTGDMVIQLMNPLSILIRIDELGGMGLFSTSRIQASFSIPLYVTSGALVQFDAESFFPQSIYRQDNTPISQLTISLIYDDGSAVDLNGSEWRMVMKLYTAGPKMGEGEYKSNCL